MERKVVRWRWQVIGSELKRYQPEKRAFVSDYESEGLNLYASRPWQVAWLIADAKNVYEREEHYIWFKDLKVSAQAAFITRFDYQRYKDRAEDPHKILARFDERLYDTSLDIIGQNFFFDGYIHNTLRRICGKQPDYSWMTRMYDTNCLSKAYRLGIQPDRTSFLSWQFKMQSIHSKLKTRLQTMCVEMGIAFDANRAHEALYDVDMTRLLYEALKWKVEF